MAAKILIVDDEESIRDFLQELLEGKGYECKTAADVAEARSLIEENEYELIICDVRMPGESGLDFAKFITKACPEIALVMISGIDDPEIAQYALEIGAYGYIVKPFKLNEVIINVSNAFLRRDLEIQNRQHRENLEKIVLERTDALLKALNDTRLAMERIVQAVALTVETRDPYTAGHQKRVSSVACAIASEMGLSDEKIEGLRMAGYIHDIGKISVPAEILSKPGKISVHEFGIIKSHPEIGYEILKDIEFPWPIAQTVYQHHERIDGSGYPLGLKDDKIIIEAKITAVADVVDAMASHRPYRPSLGVSEALSEIEKQIGVLYDPASGAACLKIFREKGFHLDSD